MKRKIVSELMLTLLVISMLTFAFSIQQVKSDWTWTETICIRADGSIEPDTAPISTVDQVTYTLTDNIVGDVPENTSALVVQRGHIVVDGAGYTLQGTTTFQSIGVSLGHNVTIRNITIKAFAIGILFWDANSTISGTHIANNEIGIRIVPPVGPTNYIFGNSITNNGIGIDAFMYTVIYHNNFIGNTVQASVTGGQVNTWDDGYPSGGNYWSDYSTRYPEAQELDGSGIWDTPYFIDDVNQDNYPLMSPLPLAQYVLTITVVGSGDTDPVPGVYTYDDGEVVSVTATADPGWTFDHWELNGDNVGSTNPINVIMTTDLTLHAVFSWVGTYDLTITTTTGGTTDPTPGIHTYTPEAVAVVSAIPDVNYWFDHWELDGNYFGSANPRSVTMNTDHTLHAVFDDTLPPPVPEYPAVDISIVAATFGFIAALYLTLKRKKQNHTTTGVTNPPRT